jgi:hypothetical protein
MLERSEKSVGVNAVVSRVDHELDPVPPKKVDHRRVAVFGRCESLL